MGELARKPGCPELADTPLGLLTPRPGEGFSFFDKAVAPTVGILTGLGIPMAANMFRSRPVWAGIHTHFISMGVFWYLARCYQQAMFAARAEKDAVYKHYISLHPEDFPPFERKRFSELYVPFKPIR